MKKEDTEIAMGVLNGYDSDSCKDGAKNETVQEQSVVFPRNRPPCSDETSVGVFCDLFSFAQLD